MNQVISLAHQVNDILTRYIKIHNAIFRFSTLKFLLNVIFLGSFLKLLPIFKTMVNIDFCAHERELNALDSQLRVIQVTMLETSESILASGTEFLTALEKYTAALSDTVNRLHDICGHLCRKSEGAKGYSMTQYKTDIKDYKESVLQYAKLGKHLNDFSNKLFSHNRPSKRLKEISQRLAVQLGPNAMTREMVLGIQAGFLSARHQAEEELFDLCENDPATFEIMQRYSATRETLRKLFVRLEFVGGAQWVGRHYVAASALAYPYTLEFLLRYFRGIDAIDATYPWPVDLTADTPERSVALRVAYEIIKYFEDSRTGPV